MSLDSIIISDITSPNVIYGLLPSGLIMTVIILTIAIGIGLADWLGRRKNKKKAEK